MRSRQEKVKSPAVVDSLLELTGTLVNSHGLANLLPAIARVFVATLAFPLAIFVADEGQLTLQHHSPEFVPDADDGADAASCISSGRRVARRKPRGRCSYFLPLNAWRGPLGALAFTVNGSSPAIPGDKWKVIEAFAHQTSLAILRADLEDKARHADRLSDADKFQKALLHSIAHNVRTPLSSVIGVLSTLQEEGTALDSSVRSDLIDTAREEAERLNRLLGNLLDLSRLEAGALHVRKDPCDVQDVIGAALDQLGSSLRNRIIDVTIAPDLPFVPMDFVLIVQVLVNLLDNALKYSPAAEPVVLEAYAVAEKLEIRVSDLGSGIAEHDLVRVFDKFNRAGTDGRNRRHGPGSIYL